jgi:hypothetical protein
MWVSARIFLTVSAAPDVSLTATAMTITWATTEKMVCAVERSRLGFDSIRLSNTSPTSAEWLAN